MALLIQMHSGALVRDSYGIPSELLIDRNEGAIIPFPTAYAELCKTLQMLPKAVIEDTSRRVDIIMRSDGDEDKHLSLLRFHGFLGSFNLHRLGNWAKTLEGCASAANILFLEPGAPENRRQWSANWAAISSLRTWASTMSQRPCKNRSNSSDMDVIRFSKRIFTRRRPLDAVEDTSDSDGTEYLREELNKVKHKWTVEDPIILGRRNPDGSISQAGASEFQQGDFVEVGASIDVVDGHDGIRVILKLEHVLLLQRLGTTHSENLRQGTGPERLSRRTAPRISFSDSYGHSRMVVDNDEQAAPAPVP